MREERGGRKKQLREETFKEEDNENEREETTESTGRRNMRQWIKETERRKRGERERG